MKYQKRNVENAALHCIGSVIDVIAGNVRSDLKTQKIDAEKYRFGFELASPHSIESMGESVLVNGYCFTTSTDPKDHYLKTISGKDFYTSGVFLVPHSALCSYTLEQQGLSGISYHDFCEKIHALAGGPCLLTAIVKCKKLSATYIQKAPIHHENIFDHKKEYYGDLKLNFDDVYCFFVSAMADFKHDSADILKKLDCVLYHNPFDASDELNVHTHGILLNQKIQIPEAISPKNVTHTLHLYSENTTLFEIIWGELFVIGDIIKE